MLDKFHELLRSHGRSVTGSRTLLFQYLLAHDGIPVRRFVADNRAIADQASLYRTLQLFRELGVIEERYVNGNKVIELSDLYDTHHHHLTCLRCGQVIPVHEDELLEARIAAVGRQEGFQPISHQLEIRGLCADCQK